MRGETRMSGLLADREREVERNAREYEQSKGAAVRYGMVIQLQHAISGKHLSVARQAAELNADSRRCLVESEGTDRAWLRVMPWLKVHSEGDHVRANDPVQLVHLATGMRLHVDLRSGAPTLIRPNPRAPQGQ